MAEPIAQPVVLVRFPSAGLVMGDAAIKWAGCTFDTLLEMSSAVEGKLVLSSLVLVRGLPETAFETLVQDLHDHYGKVEIVKSAAKSREWILRTHMASDLIESPTLRYLVRFQSQFSFPWGHIEGNQYSLRAEMRDGAAADELVQRVKAFFRTARLEADVEVVTPSPSDVMARTLLQAQLSH